MSYQFPWAAPGRKVGSIWTQTMVFPVGKWCYLCIDSVNSSSSEMGRVEQVIYVRHHVPHERGWNDNALLPHAAHPLDLFVDGSEVSNHSFVEPYLMSPTPGAYAC
jgi:hypothetical protein